MYLLVPVLYNITQPFQWYLPVLSGLQFCAKISHFSAIQIHCIVILLDLLILTSFITLCFIAL
jgi:hypothetical protein